MSDALPTPSSATRAQYEALVCDLITSVESRDDAAIGAWADAAVEQATHGVSLVASEAPDVAARRGARQLAARLKERLQKQSADFTARDAEHFVAREHGFDDWTTLLDHVEALQEPTSAVSRFEAAIDAIVTGRLRDVVTLLDSDPALIRARSTRNHRSTLLHYVAANGVEDFRQVTPANIVDITRVLIEAGADVNAESDAYGGGATALGLAATSLHPQRAGVQLALLDLLLAHGAVIERPGVAGNRHGAVLGCLANGQPEAAVFLASRGARLSLVEAAGIGRLDDVDRLLASGIHDAAEIQSAFQYACGYGHVATAQRLLEHGARASAPADKGETPLHWASGGGHRDVVDLLLAREAPLGVVDETWEGTPMDWAIYGWATANDDAARQRCRDTIMRLLSAGAACRPEWAGAELGARLRSDPDLAALLGLGLSS